MTNKSNHPSWAVVHRKSQTELKLIAGKYYLYGVKSIYDKESKKSKKISLGIIGRISESEGLVLSPKAELKKQVISKQNTIVSSTYSREYGFSYWMNNYISKEIQPRLQDNFPLHWQLILSMVYCRVVHQSPLKNMPFHLSNSFFCTLMNMDVPVEKEISNSLREIGANRKSMVNYMKSFRVEEDCVLVDATDIACHSSNIGVAEKGYNSRMDFKPQFTLLYIYSAKNHLPYFFRIVPGNIREISALKNTLKEAGVGNTTFVADKGFYSESNIEELENKKIKYIIPLRRNNKEIKYELLKEIDLKNTYFKYQNRFIFYQSYRRTDLSNKVLTIYYDGRLKEQEKQDYLSRIETMPELFSIEKYKEKIASMGTMSIVHNIAGQTEEEIYASYKSRGEIEQFFDSYKNTLSATATYMQNNESLEGWVFINHIAMQILYQIFTDLKNNELNKKYSISDFVMHLANINKITINNESSYLSELNATTKNILKKLKLSIT